MSTGTPREDVPRDGESAQDEVLQPQQGREEAGEHEEDDGVEEDEAPTHLPFAPSSEVRVPPSTLFRCCCCYGGDDLGSGEVSSTPPHGHSVEQLVLLCGQRLRRNTGGFCFS